MVLLDKLPITHAVEVVHWSSFRPGTFREQFTIRFQDGTSFWIGVVLNGRKPEWGRVRMDFNPNKIAEHEVFQLLLGYLVGNTRPMHRKIRRFDLAVDIPVLRQDAFLVKDSRAYLERRHGQEWTQYLGAKSSTVGRVKLYYKTMEAGLNYPLTRLEMTLDPATPYEKVNFPTTYYLDDYQLCFSGQKATDTERFIINALLAGCGTLDQLGRGKNMPAATHTLPPRSRTNPCREKGGSRRGSGKQKRQKKCSRRSRSTRKQGGKMQSAA